MQQTFFGAKICRVLTCYNILSFSSDKQCQTYDESQKLVGPVSCIMKLLAMLEI